MKAVFENYLHEQTELANADITRISSLAMVRKLKRNELLLSAGEICRHKAFVGSGLLRIYSISADGNESILQFTPEQHWAIDAESYNEEQPSRYFISAVEPTELLYWAKKDFSRLMEDLPLLKRYSEQLISRNIYISRNRLALALSATPEERYIDFEQKNPDLMARLPLRMIAAYLGISLKTLTRIRHAQLVR